MKKKTVNILTTILGVILILAILPVVFIIESNLALILPFMGVFGIVLIYFKNDNAIALAKRYFERFQ